jgi:oxygen-dependent protoporphyrinogen oxidase
MASFVSRRMGREVLDRLAEPLLAGIYVGDPARLSIQSTFPRFPEMLAKYGSLTKGTLAQMEAAQRATATTPKMPMFMTLKGGLKELIETLAGRLTGDLLTGRQVKQLQVDTKSPSPYRLHLSDGQQLRADAVILATPAPISAQLLADHSPDLAQALRGIRYISSATISLAFRRDELGHSLNGFGFVVPKVEDCELLACTWVSTKFDHRAPADGVLLRAFVGGYSREELVDLPDDQLIRLTRNELKHIMGIAATPMHQRIYRWPQGNPQYDVGHLDRVAAIEAIAADHLPGLYLTGSAFYGVGLPDCVRQGQETAAKTITHLKARSSHQQYAEAEA